MSHAGRAWMESSDKTWSTGEGNGKPLQYCCLEKPMNGMKRQKDETSGFIQTRERREGRFRCWAMTIHSAWHQPWKARQCGSRYAMLGRSIYQLSPLPLPWLAPTAPPAALCTATAFLAFVSLRSVFSISPGLNSSLPSTLQIGVICPVRPQQYFPWVIHPSIRAPGGLGAEKLDDWRHGREWVQGSERAGWGIVATAECVRAARERDEPFQHWKNQKIIYISLLCFLVTFIHSFSLLFKKKSLSTLRTGMMLSTGYTAVNKTQSVSLFQNQGICSPKKECPPFKAFNSLSANPNKSL